MQRFQPLLAFGTNRLRRCHCAVQNYPGRIGPSCSRPHQVAPHEQTPVAAAAAAQPPRRPWLAQVVLPACLVFWTAGSAEWPESARQAPRRLAEQAVGRWIPSHPSGLRWTTPVRQAWQCAGRTNANAELTRQLKSATPVL